MLISATNTALKRLSPTYKYENNGWNPDTIKTKKLRSRIKSKIAKVAKFYKLTSN